MPLRHKLKTRFDPAIDALRQRLIDEWRNPQEQVPAPVIIEEAGTQNRPTRLYVIWDDWTDLDQEERSEIIMDAYETVRGADKALQVTVAMGLTRREADRMKIEYE
jgi:hypothetical protein